MSGAIGGIAPLTATLFAPIAGVLCDRLPRVRAVMWMAVLSALAYNGMSFIEDPTGPRMMLMMGLMGMADRRLRREPGPRLAAGAARAPRPKNRALVASAPSSSRARIGGASSTPNIR